MTMWNNPTISVFEKEKLAKTIKAKAYTVGQGLTIGQLVAQGVGASGICQLPDGTMADVYVAAQNDVTGITTVIVNGTIMFYSILVGLFL